MLNLEATFNAVETLFEISQVFTSLFDSSQILTFAGSVLGPLHHRRGHQAF